MNIENIVKNSGANISDDMLPEVAKVVDYLVAEHKKELSEFEEVLKDLACRFEYGADNVEKVNPKVFYRKIIWGINDMSK